MTYCDCFRVVEILPSAFLKKIFIWRPHKNFSPLAQSVEKLSHRENGTGTSDADPLRIIVRDRIVNSVVDKNMYNHSCRKPLLAYSKWIWKRLWSKKTDLHLCIGPWVTNVAFIDVFLIVNTYRNCRKCNKQFGISNRVHGHVNWVRVGAFSVWKFFQSKHRPSPDEGMASKPSKV